MSDSSNEQLIDYLLGRLTPEEAEAFEKCVRNNAVLSRDLDILQKELGILGRTPSLHRHSSSPASESQEPTSQISTKLPETAESSEKLDPSCKTEALVSPKSLDSKDMLPKGRHFNTTSLVDTQDGLYVSKDTRIPQVGSSSNIRRPKLHFIPKRVVAPRRKDDALIFKRAVQLSVEEHAKRSIRPSRLSKEQLRATLLSKDTYTLATAAPLEKNYICLQTTEHGQLQIWTIVSPIEVNELAVTVDSAPISEAFVALVPTLGFDTTETVTIHRANSSDGNGILFTYYASNETLPNQQVITLHGEAVTRTLYNIRLRGYNTLDQAFNTTIAVGEDTRVRFTLFPLEYMIGRASYVNNSAYVSNTAVAEQYQLMEFEGAEDVANGHKQSIPEKAPTFIRGTESQETRALVEEWIAAEVSGYTTVFPGARIIPQSTYSTISTLLESVSEEDPVTLTAEDKRLTELLGRNPDPIELSEYYWEDDSQVKRSTSPEVPTSHGIVKGVLYILITPPIWIGHKTIAAFSKLVPTTKTQNGFNTQREKARVSDAVISIVAGVALAVGIVFPALKYVVQELIVTVLTSKVRSISGNFSFSPGATEADVLPFISEQILFPHYETVEFDVNSSESVGSIEYQSE